MTKADRNYYLTSVEAAFQLFYTAKAKQDANWATMYNRTSPGATLIYMRGVSAAINEAREAGISEAAISEAQKSGKALAW